MKKMEMKWDLAEPPTLRGLTRYVTPLRQRSVTHLTVDWTKSGILGGSYSCLMLLSSGQIISLRFVAFNVMCFESVWQFG